MKPFYLTKLRCKKMNVAHMYMINANSLNLAIFAGFTSAFASIL
jgi:hypothetical protein